MLEFSVAPVPERRCLPRAASVENQHRCSVEPGERVCAYRVREVMVYKSEFRFRRRESHAKRLLAILLAREAQVPAQCTYEVPIVPGYRADGHAFKVVAESRRCRRPPETDIIEFLG